MNILVSGPEALLAEFKERYGTPDFIRYSAESINQLQEGEEVIFDFWVDEDPERLQDYHSHPGLTVFLNIPKYSLADLVYQMGMPESTLIGFNGLPTFINRPLLEVSLLNKQDEGKLKQICGQLDTEYRLVADRVGMITPRIIFQIINEAYYTMQEGTATGEDIDLGMKLGTNYPVGPVEWSKQIGLHHIYELLEALWHDTHDERYKVCPLLKQQYLKEQAGLAAM